MVGRWLTRISFFPLLLLVGCGFHLRGNTQLSPLLARVYMQGIVPYSELGIGLKRSLEANGATVTSDPKEATAILGVIYNQLQRQVLSVGSTGKVQEYALKYVLQFQVANPQGQILLPPQRVELMREYQFDERSVLSSGEQEALLRKTMQKEMVQQILWRLESLSPALNG